MYTCFHIYETAVIIPYANWLDQQVSELGDEEQTEETLADSESVFIAFPFTIKAVQSDFYRATDTEWLEYVKISKDKTLQKKVQRMLPQPFADRLNRRS